MKTLLATHAWLDCPVEGYSDKDGSCRRIMRWLKHYSLLDLSTVVVDNGSNPLVCDGYAARERIGVINLRPHYASVSLAWDYPNVWRAYWSLKEMLEIYDRIFYIATDAYVLSPRLLDWLFAQKEGWSALWCPRYNFPEPQIQVITKCDAFMNFFAGPCDPFKYNGKCEEITLPFTHVEKGFIGDRYGDDPAWHWPPDADYFCQVPDSFDWSDDVFPKLTRSASESTAY